MQKPLTTEYHPFYETYISKVPNGELLTLFEAQTQKYLALLESLTEAQWDYAYAPEKWTIKEAVVHMMDAERVFAYRVLRIARGDQKPMPGFEQNDYVPNSEANARNSQSILEEFRALRQSTLLFLKSLTPQMLDRKGTASGAEVSARAICHIIVGHDLHHFQIIEDRYLKL